MSRGPPEVLGTSRGRGAGDIQRRLGHPEVPGTPRVAGDIQRCRGPQSQAPKGPGIARGPGDIHRCQGPQLSRNIRRCKGPKWSGEHPEVPRTPVVPGTSRSLGEPLRYRGPPEVPRTPRGRGDIRRFQGPPEVQGPTEVLGTSRGPGVIQRSPGHPGVPGTPRSPGNPQNQEPESGTPRRMPQLQGDSKEDLNQNP